MLLRNALLADGGRVDVRIDGGLVDQVRPAGTIEARPGEHVEELDGYILLPSPVDPHAHLDKALLGERAPNPHGDLRMREPPSARSTAGSTRPTSRGAPARRR